jgi:translation initiation factor 5B
MVRNQTEFKSTVMEVKKIEGLGMTADLIVVNGLLKVDDKIVLSGT